ncbi:hypothetical protein [Gordonia polyisoprenivorans]|uniref:hypothetical protein n=1 Tax=Gordonia polyisoprenivorans TaxID=84595 RepID=UPI0002DDCB0A|nr:hypothetical protein [Gordonia polyisoprenivorans]
MEAHKPAATSPRTEAAVFWLSDETANWEPFIVGDQQIGEINTVRDRTVGAD